ncbi:hypothetical protein OROMI_025400 [Orobanche minor]
MDTYEVILVDDSFPLFSQNKHKQFRSSAVENPSSPPKILLPSPNLTTSSGLGLSHWALETCKELGLKKTTPVPSPNLTTFSGLGLSDWIVQTCKELGLKKPTQVQQHCIPPILAGKDLLGLSQTGSGKTAAFALPILHRLSQDPYGVFALVITPTRELAFQLAEQFRALASLNLKCAVVVGGMDMSNQSKDLMDRPHIVVATPGRLKVLLQNNPDMPAVFSRTKFLVLDEADRVLDIGFEKELRVVFQTLPKSRQTLLFSATMTSDLKTLLELSANKAYIYEAYEGFQTIDSLKQQFVYTPQNVKELYLLHILSRMKDMEIRSSMIFVSTCRSCHLLGLLLEELDVEVAVLHSFKSQASRLAALYQFKSGKAPLLLATDVASRGLDIPTVDLVVNYDIPRLPRDYVHRVGRTARAGRGGLAISLVTQCYVTWTRDLVSDTDTDPSAGYNFLNNFGHRDTVLNLDTANDIDLILQIEADVGKKLVEFKCKENEVVEDITKVFKARRVAKMKMMDDGFEEKAEARKAQKLKAFSEKGLLNNKKRRRGGKHANK